MSEPWGQRVPLYQGELFSTWLVRAALAQGCDPLILTGFVWPRWRAWTRDLDRGLDDRQMNLLTAASGISGTDLEEATLRPTMAAITPDVRSSFGSWPWMLAQGARNRRRFGGLAYCPACLEASPEPWFKRHWRLGWHVGCERHGILLVDHCWTCRAPIEPHRCKALDGVLSRCPSCGSDLRNGPTAAVCPEALAFQMAADKVVADGRGIWADTCLDAPQWFARAKADAFGCLWIRAIDDLPDALTFLPLNLQRPSERVLRLRMACRAMRGENKGRRLKVRTVEATTRARAFEAVSAPVGRLANIPVPRPSAKVKGEWVRLLRRMRLAQI